MASSCWSSSRRRRCFSPRACSDSWKVACSPSPTSTPWTCSAPSTGRAGYAVIWVGSVVAIFFQYPVGWLADKVDRGWLLVGCVAIMAIQHRTAAGSESMPGHRHGGHREHCCSGRRYLSGVAQWAPPSRWASPCSESVSGRSRLVAGQRSVQPAVRHRGRGRPLRGGQRDGPFRTRRVSRLVGNRGVSHTCCSRATARRREDGVSPPDRESSTPVALSCATAHLAAEQNTVPSRDLSALPLTTTHWGAYRAEVSDGKLVGLHGYETDPDPSSIAQGMLDTLDDPCRIPQPMVRKGWLEHGISADRSGGGREPFVAVSWEDRGAPGGGRAPPGDQPVSVIERFFGGVVRLGKLGPIPSRADPAIPIPQLHRRLHHGGATPTASRPARSFFPTFSAPGCIRSWPDTPVGHRSSSTPISWSRSVGCR